MLPTILICGRRDMRALRIVQQRGLEPHCVYPERDVGNPVRGCYAAHTLALQTAQAKGWIPCLILEDNLDMCGDWDAESVMSAVSYALQQGASLVSLSRFPFSHHANLVGFVLHKRTGHPRVLKLDQRSVNGTTAYVATAKTLALWPPWRERHLDSEMADWPERYAVHPMPFCRASIPTTNRWTIGGQVNGTPVPFAQLLPHIIPTYCNWAQYFDNDSAIQFIVLALLFGIVLRLVVTRGLAMIA